MKFFVNRIEVFQVNCLCIHVLRLHRKLIQTSAVFAINWELKNIRVDVVDVGNGKSQNKARQRISKEIEKVLLFGV